MTSAKICPARSITAISAGDFSVIIAGSSPPGQRLAFVRARRRLDGASSLVALLGEDVPVRAHPKLLLGTPRRGATVAAGHVCLEPEGVPRCRCRYCSLGRFLAHLILHSASFAAYRDVSSLIARVALTLFL
jgi:hypothetical protein